MAFFCGTGVFAICDEAADAKYFAMFINLLSVGQLEACLSMVELAEHLKIQLPFASILRNVVRDYLDSEEELTFTATLDPTFRVALSTICPSVENLRFALCSNARKLGITAPPECHVNDPIVIVTLVHTLGTVAFGAAEGPFEDRLKARNAVLSMCDFILDHDGEHDKLHFNRFVSLFDYFERTVHRKVAVTISTPLAPREFQHLRASSSFNSLTIGESFAPAESIDSSTSRISPDSIAFAEKVDQEASWEPYHDVLRELWCRTYQYVSFVSYREFFHSANSSGPISPYVAELYSAPMLSSVAQAKLLSIFVPSVWQQDHRAEDPYPVDLFCRPENLNEITRRSLINVLVQRESLLPLLRGYLAYYSSGAVPEVTRRNRNLRAAPPVPSHPQWTEFIRDILFEQSSGDLPHVFTHVARTVISHLTSSRTSTSSSSFFPVVKAFLDSPLFFPLRPFICYELYGVASRRSKLFGSVHQLTFDDHTMLIEYLTESPLLAGTTGAPSPPDSARSGRRLGASSADSLSGLHTHPCRRFSEKLRFCVKMCSFVLKNLPSWMEAIPASMQEAKVPNDAQLLLYLLRSECHVLPLVLQSSLCNNQFFLNHLLKIMASAGISKRQQSSTHSTPEKPKLESTETSVLSSTMPSSFCFSIRQQILMLHFLQLCDFVLRATRSKTSSEYPTEKAIAGSIAHISAVNSAMQQLFCSSAELRKDGILTEFLQQMSDRVALLVVTMLLQRMFLATRESHSPSENIISARKLFFRDFVNALLREMPCLSPPCCSLLRIVFFRSQLGDLTSALRPLPEVDATYDPFCVSPLRYLLDAVHEGQFDRMRHVLQNLFVVSRSRAIKAPLNTTEVLRFAVGCYRLAEVSEGHLSVEFALQTGLDPTDVLFHLPLNDSASLSAVLPGALASPVKKRLLGTRPFLSVIMEMLPADALPSELYRKILADALRADASFSAAERLAFSLQRARKFFRSTSCTVSDLAGLGAESDHLWESSQSVERPMFSKVTAQIQALSTLLKKVVSSKKSEWDIANTVLENGLGKLFELVCEGHGKQIVAEAHATPSFGVNEVVFAVLAEYCTRDHKLLVHQESNLFDFFAGHFSDSDSPLLILFAGSSQSRDIAKALPSLSRQAAAPSPLFHWLQRQALLGEFFAGFDASHNTRGPQTDSLSWRDFVFRSGNLAMRLLRYVSRFALPAVTNSEADVELTRFLCIFHSELISAVVDMEPQEAEPVLYSFVAALLKCSSHRSALAAGLDALRFTSEEFEGILVEFLLCMSVAARIKMLLEFEPIRKGPHLGSLLRNTVTFGTQLCIAESLFGIVSHSNKQQLAQLRNVMTRLRSYCLMQQCLLSIDPTISDPINFAQIPHADVERYVASFTENGKTGAAVQLLNICGSEAAFSSQHGMLEFLVDMHCKILHQILLQQHNMHPNRTTHKAYFEAVKYINNVAVSEFSRMNSDGDSTVDVPSPSIGRRSIVVQLVAAILDNKKELFDRALIHRVVQYCLDSSFLSSLFAANVRWRRATIGLSTFLCLEKTSVGSMFPPSFLAQPLLVIENLLMSELVQEAASVLRAVEQLQCDEMLMFYARLAVDCSIFDTCGEEEFPFGLPETPVQMPAPPNVTSLSIRLRPEHSSTELETIRSSFRYSSSPNIGLFRQLHRMCADREYADEECFSIAVGVFEGLGEYDSQAVKVVAIDVAEKILRCCQESGVVKRAETLLAKFEISRHLIVARWEEHPRLDDLDSRDAVLRLVTELHVEHTKAAFAIAATCGVDISGVESLWIDRTMQLLRLGLFTEAVNALRHLKRERVREVLHVMTEFVEHTPLPVVGYAASQGGEQIVVRRISPDDALVVLRQRRDGVRQLLQEYGEPSDLTRFFVREGSIDKAVEISFADRGGKKVDFLDCVFIPCDEANSLDLLRNVLKLRDVTLESLRTEIVACCRYLESCERFKDLLQWQQWMHDSSSGAITAMNLSASCTVFDTKLQYLNAAEQMLLEAKFQSSGSTSAVADDGTVLPPCSFSPQELQRQLNLCRLQKDLIVLLNAANMDCNRIALFGSDYVKKEVVDELLQLGRNFFDLATRIMSAFDLSPAECYVSACRRLSRAKKQDAVDTLVDALRRSITISPADRNLVFLELIRVYLTDFAGSSRYQKAAESLLQYMTVDRGHRASAFLLLKRFREAYADAVQLNDSELAIQIFEQLISVPPTTVVQELLTQVKRFLFRVAPEYLKKHTT